MLPYSKFILEKEQPFLMLNEDSLLLEKLLTFGGGRPRYDNVVIMAGGSASGKGFILQNLVGIEGRVFDVDQLKSMALKSTIIRQKVLDSKGIDVALLDMKNSDDVALLHSIVSELGLTDKKMNAQLASIIGAKNKPNLIFDATMSTLTKLDNIVWHVNRLGYKKENIHIVWVVNDIETAIEQNANRDRSVSVDVLKSTHEGVAVTVKSILNSYVSIDSYMDGDFYIVFNKKGVDTFLHTSGLGGKFISDSLFVKIKDQGKKIKHISELDDEIVQKLEQYTKVKFR